MVNLKSIILILGHVENLIPSRPKLLLFYEGVKYPFSSANNRIILYVDHRFMVWNFLLDVIQSLLFDSGLKYIIEFLKVSHS